MCETCRMTNEVRTVRATSWDVARVAGVSRSTVSQVLNGNDARFPQETRDRVNAAADQLSYRPSRAGRSLVTGLSDLIVVVVPNVTFGRHLQDAVEGLSVATLPMGMSVVLRYADTDPSVTLAAILDLRPAYVIDLGVFDDRARSSLVASGIQVVPTDQTIARITEDPNHFIGRLQVEHVLANGDRRIVCALLLDDRVDVLGPMRQLGVTDAAAARGLDSPIAIRVPLTVEGAVDALSGALAQSGGQALAVCCYNDDVAIAMVAAARELGLAIPTDVSIIGVDRTQVGQLIVPRLSSIEVDFPRILRSIGQLISGDSDSVEWWNSEDLVRVVVGETT